MIIQEIKIQNFGPFYQKTNIEFSPDVTVLTGANDTGKTALLDLIYLIVTNNDMNENQANLDRVLSSNSPWDEDDGVTCDINYRGTFNSTKYMALKNFDENSIIETSYVLPPKVKKRVVSIFRRIDQEIVIKSNVFKDIPQVLYITSNTMQINPIINLKNPNALEELLLFLAFRQNPLQKIKSLNEWLLPTFLETADKEINKFLQSILPKAINFEVKFKKIETENLLGLTLLFKDKHFGNAPLHLRGSGVRKIISVALMLLDRRLEENFVYVLIDEPENSLHADAQHTFRHFLEELGKKPNIQVIYSTHSSAMINPFRPDTIRLLTRNNIDGIASTEVNNHPQGNNFELIRSSLGLSLSDSLLYGPLTVISEGPTEVSSIRLILERIAKEKPELFPNSEKILPLLFILDGHGDSYEYWSSLLKQQGNELLIFIDGDKKKKVQQEVANKKLENIPIITLAEGKEFEDLVPIEDYFTSIQKETGIQELSITDFLNWCSEKKLPEKMLISKKIHFWFDEVYPTKYYDKPKTMQICLKDINFDKICLDPFLDLIKEISRISEKF